MANNATKARGQQLIRTDDKVSGVVKFYDRRVEDVTKAYVCELNVGKMVEQAGLTVEMMKHPMMVAVIKLAVHGATQNLLDTSNSLSGNERLAHIKTQAQIVQNGGWASVPVDEAAQRESAITGLTKMGIQRAQAEKMVDKAVADAKAAAKK